MSTCLLEQLNIIHVIYIFPVLIISLDRNIAELDANHTSRIRAGRLQNTCR